MAEPRDYRQADLFRPALEAIIDMGHPLVRLAGKIDWGFLDRRLGEVYAAGDGQPPLPVRLIAGFVILKHMHSLSDEAVCARWVENPYFQYFCGERVFRHALAFDRSSLTRWRQRLGEERLSALLQESLSGRPRNGSAGDEGPRAGRRRHDGAAEGDRPSDRRQAHSQGDREVRRLRQAPWRRAQAELSEGRQAGGDHGLPLYPRPPVQARQLRAQVPAHALGKADPRHQPQDLRRPGARRTLRAAARPGGQDPLPESAPARAEGLFAARPGGRVHRQGQGPGALRVRLQGVDSPSLSRSPRAASSSCTPRRCTAIPSTAIR